MLVQPDPWTIRGLGFPNPAQWKICISKALAFCISSSASTDSAPYGWCSTGVLTTKNHLCVSGALQFKPVLFNGHLCCFFFNFLGTFFAVLNAPKHSAKVQSRIPKRKMAVRCLLEKLCVLEKLPSGLGYCVAGPDFSLNEPALYILHNVCLNRNT